MNLALLPSSSYTGGTPPRMIGMGGLGSTLVANRQDHLRSFFLSSPPHGVSLCFSFPLQGFSSSFTTSFLGSGRWCTVRVSDCVRHLCLRPGGEQRLFHARLDPGACFFFLLLQDFRGGTWDRCPRDLVVSIFFCFRHDDILPVLDLRELFMWFFFSFQFS